MNRDETKQAIVVMQAWVDGAEIEVARRYEGMHPEWLPCPFDPPAWNWEHYNYRVKPGPREFWLHHTSGQVYDVMDCNRKFTGKGWLRVREVIE